MVIKLIKKWLGVDLLEKRIKELEKECKELKRPDNLMNAVEQIADKTVNVLYDVKKIQEYFQIGIDVHHVKTNSGSWAVLCCNGRTEYVKFLDLRRKDFLHLRELLKSFPSQNRCIDCGPHFKNILGDNNGKN